MLPIRPTVMTACLAASLPLVAVEQEDVVAEVVIEGTRRVHPARVQGELHTHVGMTRREALRKGRDDVAHLESMGPFTGATSRIVNIGPGQIRVVFTVEELPFVGAVGFEGVGFLTRNSLEDVITLKRGSYLNPILLEADRRALEEHLRNDKHFRATVETRVALDETSGIAYVTYVVDPGDEVQVGYLRYRGLPPEISRRKINAELLEGGNPTRALINRPGMPFAEDMVRWDADEVAGAMQDLGYLDAAVIEHEWHFFDQVPAYQRRSRTGPVLAPDGRFDNRVVLVYHIEPGQRYHLGTVSFVLDDLDGESPVTETALREAFALPEGHPLIREDLETVKREALSLLRDQGYARAEFREDPIYDLDQRRVDLVLQLSEGRRYRVRRLDVAGNTVTKDAVVRRALRLRPGQLWSDEDRDRSVREMLRTGVFSNEPIERPRIQPRWETARPATDDPEIHEVDVVAEVTETSTGSFRFNLGYSTAVGLAGEVEFSERNFDLLGTMRGESWRGAGQHLAANASWSKERQSFHIGWTNPHLMDGPYSLSTAFTRTDSSSLDWDVLRHVPRLTVGRHLFDNDLRLSAYYQYTDLEVDDLDDDASDLALNGAGKHYLNTVGLQQTLDLLDNARFPTSGLRIRFEEELNGLILPATADYLRLESDFDVFYPLYEGDIGGVTYIRLSQQNEYLQELDDTGNVPFYDRLYGGGPAPRHRGFDSYDLGPRAINRNGYESRPGGTSKWLTTFELSVPLQGTNTGFRGVVFSDIGNVWGEDEDIDLGDLRSAAGFGLRFPVMVLPVSLDFAWLLDAKDDEDSFNVHFNVSGFVF